MPEYESMLDQAHLRGISVKEKTLKSNADGLIFGNRIVLNKSKLNTTVQKKCVLAEELAHYDLTVGNIINMQSVENRKQEFKSRFVSYNRFIGLLGIVNAYKAGCHNLYDMAEYLKVTEDFLSEALDCYRSKYGVYAKIDNYIVYFLPTLMVMKLVQGDTRTLID